MKKVLGICFFILLSSTKSFGQNDQYLEKGHLTLGVRTTTSLFDHDNIPGLGSGGQFRLQLFDFLSTEGFADWITQDLKGAGTRKNAHIGWSVLFYPKKFNRITPYVSAGHCFDFTQVRPLSTPFENRSGETLQQWSSAAQIGVGSHFFISQRFNLSLSAQYMLHFGDQLGYELNEVSEGEYFLKVGPQLQGEKNTEGHLLLSVSLNYRIGDLW